MTAAEGLTFERLTTLEATDFAQIITLEETSFSNPWTPDALTEMLSSPVTQLHVARRATREIVAFCACWLIADELHINTLAVHVTMRRQGIATGLLRHILATTGAKRATLEVRRSNQAALELYARLGFTTTAVRSRYYSQPEEDALILWLHP
jgi:ribosomal-protein-alanine N-acetyltransferase